MSFLLPRASQFSPCASLQDPPYLLLLGHLLPPRLHYVLLVQFRLHLRKEAAAKKRLVYQPETGPVAPASHFRGLGLEESVLAGSPHLGGSCGRSLPLNKAQLIGTAMNTDRQVELCVSFTKGK